MLPATANKWLSPHRLDVYTQHTNGDLDAALELYDWNAAVTAACLRDIGHFEVLIRNRYADQLTAGYADWTSENSPLWTKENGHPKARNRQRDANNRSRRAVAEARAKAPSQTPGHIVAQLTFGFWTNLTISAREPTIWTPMLSSTIPGKPRGPHHDQMVKLNNFRNRLAHWEPVFSNTTGLVKRLDEFDALFHTIDTTVAAWAGSRSAVLDILDSCPIPHLRPAVLTYLGDSP